MTSHMLALSFICHFLVVRYLSVKLSGMCLMTMCEKKVTVTAMEGSCFLQGKWGVHPAITES